METYRLLVTLHLLGAAVWVGGHLVLSLAILPRALRARDPSIVRGFESGYERIGVPALVLQVITGLWLAYRSSPDVAGWVYPSTPQAKFILVKLTLLAFTVALAAHARLRITPRLDSNTLPVLAWHVVMVTLAAVAFLVFGVAIRTGGLW